MENGKAGVLYFTLGQQRQQPTLTLALFPFPWAFFAHENGTGVLWPNGRASFHRGHGNGDCKVLDFLFPFPHSQLTGMHACRQAGQSTMHDDTKVFLSHPLATMLLSCPYPLFVHALHTSQQRAQSRDGCRTARPSRVACSSDSLHSVGPSP